MTKEQIEKLINSVVHKSNMKTEDESFKEEALYRTQKLLKMFLVDALLLDSDYIIKHLKGLNNE